MDEQKVKKLIRDLIIEIGEDPTREGLAKTPERIVGVYKEIFNGYEADSELSVQFSEDSEIVVVRNNANVTSAAFRGIYDRKEEKERIVELIKNPTKSSFP